ncbi:hypothetical protein CCHL11_07856 [Colletotrichum chlorophyti]|uniref:Uncharacterized protein n=1 Tax=Colletotrichum chlorophyti TaxID=708187 RepID=A0A1Q8RR32_9PEZI|nr:hypothetical protein CCHL11_07856 [Colletotrichum chlorophyti]
MHPPRSVLAGLTLVAFASGQACYWPDGGRASSLIACPVAVGTEVASCCFRNHYCMSNGLCFSKTELSFYRGGCTDSDWSKSGCPKYCDKDGIAGAVPGRHCGIALCGNGNFACQNTGNCDNDTFSVPAGTMLFNQFLQSDLGDIATATARATVTVAVETEAIATATYGAGTRSTCAATAEATKGISTGAAAGIGVGVGAPLALAIVALTIMLLREKGRTRAALENQNQIQQQYPNPGQYPSARAPPLSPWAKSEHTAYNVPAEVSAHTLPPELPSNHHGRPELS